MKYISLDPEDHKKIKELAEQEDRTVTNMINHLIKGYLKEKGFGPGQSSSSAAFPSGPSARGLTDQDSTNKDILK